MKSTIFRLLNLYSGEEKNAFLFATLAFCWSLGINLGLKYSDALLLINIGAQALPTVYIFCALGMIIPATILLTVVNKVRSQNILLTIIGAVITFYASVFIFLKSGGGQDVKWIWYVLRILSFQLDTLLIMSYWTFIDQYHNMQDAKRMYVLFSLTVFCGQATTGLIMQSGLLSFTTVLLLIICLMIISVVLIKVITSTVHLAHDQSTGEEEALGSKGITISKTIKDILKSRFTLLVMLNNFLIFLMWVSAEYNYLKFFDMYFDPPGTVLPEGGARNAEITLFLGRMIATVSVTNLIFGLFLYSRLIRRFGVTSLLFFTPVIMIIAMSGWSLYPVIIFPVMSYFLVEGFLEIVDESNFSLLLNAVPKNLKYRVRILIESFLEPMAMLSSGFLLSIPGINTVSLCLGLSIAAFIAAMVIRKKYHNSVYKNLAANAIHPERSIREWFDKLSPEGLEKERFRLFSIIDAPSNHAEKKFALEGLLGLKEVDTIGKLVTKVRAQDATTQILFLQMLSESPLSSEKIVIDQLLSWLSDSAANPDNVYSHILFFLAQTGRIHPENVNKEIESDNLIRKASAILALKKTGTHVSTSMLVQNRKQADEALKIMLKSNDEEEVSIALKVLSSEATPTHHNLLITFFDHPTKKIRHIAMESFAKISCPQCRKYSKLLLSFLKKSEDSTFRKACIKALGKIKEPLIMREVIAASLHFRQGERRLIESIIRTMGLSTVPMLLAVTKDTSMPDRCRALAGRIVGHLALPHLHANINEIMSAEIERAYFYFCHYQFIEQKNPDKDLSLLVEALKAGYHSVIDFIIQLLSSAGEVEDSELISRLFKSPDIKLRSQVVETLEKTCDQKIFQKLRPLMEDIPAEEILNQYNQTGFNILSLPELLEKLFSSPTPVDTIVSMKYMKKFDYPNWKSSLDALSKSNEKIYNHFAGELKTS
ncbi:MAG: hypothetical protein VX777_08275 [Chlamydiota bacterium]|nr:hypothetical protein [Chlamydiota bacterium]